MKQYLFALSTILLAACGGPQQSEGNGQYKSFKLGDNILAACIGTGLFAKIDASLIVENLDVEVYCLNSIPRFCLESGECPWRSQSNNTPAGTSVASTTPKPSSTGLTGDTVTIPGYLQDNFTCPEDMDPMFVMRDGVAFSCIDNELVVKTENKTLKTLANEENGLEFVQTVDCDGITVRSNSTPWDGNACSMFDGNQNTRWTSNREDSLDMTVFEVDYGTTTSFKTIYLDIKGFDSWKQTFTVTTSSDGNAWTEILTVTEQTGIWNIPITEPFRYMRLNSTYSGDSGQVNVYEFSAYETSLEDVGQMANCSGAVVTMNSPFEGSACNIMDGLAYTRWSSNRLDNLPEVIYAVDYGSVKTFTTIQLNIAGMDNWEQDFTVSISSDNAAWTELLNVVHESGSWNIPVNTPFRYMKFVSTWSEDHGQVNVYEFKAR